MKYSIYIFFFCLAISSCAEKFENREQALYQTYCASCHIAPAPDALPRHIWESNILPEMGARLGIRENGFDPYKGLSMDEQYAVIQSGTYPSEPLIQPADWEILKNYVLASAPDSLLPSKKQPDAREIVRFRSVPVALDSLQGSMITTLQFSAGGDTLIFGEVSGKLSAYDFSSGQVSGLGRFGRGITSYSKAGNIAYITSVGYLDPSEIPSGRIFIASGDSISLLPDVLHRPVHTTVHDIDEDGTKELVVCEFGDLQGALSLYSLTPDKGWQRKVLLDQPGSTRTVVVDLDRDGRKDVIVLTAQGDEGITAFYQRQPLEFEAVNLIRFSPVYGSSWFEVVDYEGDGDLDIITVHGDNADKSFVPKPYHGLRIHLNDGNAKFREAYFYPMNGATRVVAADFDQDGDCDFGLLSTFPNFSARPLRTFTYLENIDTSSFEFQPYAPDGSKTGRWFLMDKADIDKDGDEDIVLSSFTYYFSPVPDSLKLEWATSKDDLMILENNLYTGNE